jgi:hypothetical protein
MSIDFDCYLAKKPFISFKTIEGDGWQIAFYGPTLTFEPDDIDPEILDKIEARSYLIQFHLEGRASDEAFQRLEELFNKLIKKHDACIYDPQQDSITSRKGRHSIVRKPIKAEIEKTASLTFYFDQKTAFTREQRLSFYELIETIIPKALPRRYGHYEPMQYKLAENGKEHFLQHWHDDSLGILWRGSAPYQWIYSSLESSRPKNHNVINPKERFICQKIEILFSSKLLETKKSVSKLMQFQIAASKLLKVFYSEIRFGDSFSHRNWRGLPKDPALSVIVGEPYASLWPDFTDNSDQIDTDLYMRRYLSSEHSIPLIPNELIEPDLPKENPLNSGPPIAQVLPFEIPKKSKGIPERYKA